MPFVNEDPAMEAVLVELRRIAECLERMEKRPRAAAGAAAEATDAELDSQHGDPEVRKAPPRWHGEDLPFPRRMSECPPELLDVLASFYDWQAEHSEPRNGKSAEQIAGYRRRDAARARGWKRRLLAGWKRPGSDETPPDDNQPAGW